MMLIGPVENRMRTPIISFPWTEEERFKGYEAIEE